jgi:hypothetical protein
MRDEGKLVVITEQMPIMRSLLDFQLASRVLHWDGNTEVTGSLCDITSSPCCHSSCNHPTKRVPWGGGQPHLFPLMGSILLPSMLRGKRTGMPLLFERRKQLI